MGNLKKNSNRGHCHFFKLTGDIRPFRNRQEQFRNSNNGHCYFMILTGDIGDPPPPHQGPLHGPRGRNYHVGTCDVDFKGCQRLFYWVILVKLCIRLSDFTDI